MTPVWFMRQAGHCLAEYRKLREQYDILTIARTPELCSQVSLLPVDSYGVDAAVMYTDIVLPLPGMGLEVELSPTLGPLIAHPIRTLEDVAALRVPEVVETTPFVPEAIGLVRHALADRQAVIGIAGGPCTLAFYVIEGGASRDYSTAKALMYQHPEVWHALLEKITAVLIRYVQAEALAGADAVQIFDTNVGALSPAAYAEFVQPYTRRVMAAIREAGAMSIHFAVANAGLLELMAVVDCDVVGVDWRVDIADAWRRIDGLAGQGSALAHQRAIMGNLDPTVLLAPWETVEAEARAVLTQVGRRSGHIFNLGHAIHPASNPDYLRRLVSTVHECTARS
jgi:uroporphyrinogen decarboxylase